MKFFSSIFILIQILLVSASLAQTSVSGSFESSISVNAGAGEDNGTDNMSYGVEEYANVRMQTKIGSTAVVFGAVNFIAAAGDYALKSVALGADIDSGGKNYVAQVELERLYFRLKGESVTLDGGLLRLPFGYSSVWGPSDFLNPKNPLKPDARPRAVLGSGLSWYPIDDFKVLGFAATGRDPFKHRGGIVGVSADRHWNAASVQLLYAVENSGQFPGTPKNPWAHRLGMSVKADVAAGIVLDMLYTYNREIKDRLEDGLSLSAGADYSLFDARLIILAEYLYNGAASSTSILGGGSFVNRNYLYAGLTWRVSDLTNVGLAIIAGIDDVSAVPLITASSEVYQGVTVSLMAQIPVDKDLLFNDGNRGELGPLPPGVNAGSHFYLESKVKFKF